jgi:hypothetical protein
MLGFLKKEREEETVSMVGYYSTNPEDAEFNERHIADLEAIKQRFMDFRIMLALTKNKKRS